MLRSGDRVVCSKIKAYKSTRKMVTPPSSILVPVVGSMFKLWSHFVSPILRLSEAARHKLTHVRAASMPAEMEVRFVQLPATGALFYT